ncbi:MAG: hypothetical protein JEZ07_18890 [Phycisphaerae bacterium]|nr:hypothetical protein [Phycisphaerae bacterium]
MTKSSIIEIKSDQKCLFEPFGALKKSENQTLMLDIDDPETLKDEALAELLRQSYQGGPGPVAGISTSKYDLFDFIDRDKDLYNTALEFFTQTMEIMQKSKKPYSRKDSYSKPAITLPIPILIIRANHIIKINDYEMAYNNIFLALEALAKSADQLGVFMAFENPASGILLSPLEIRGILNHFNTPYAGLCFNPGHASKLGSPIDWLNIFDRRVLALLMSGDWPEIQARYEQIPLCGTIIQTKIEQP